MLKFILSLSLFMALSGAVDAHRAFVNIEKADKVVIKSGRGHQKHKAMKMIKCLMALKKYKTAEEAIADKKAKMQEACDRYTLSAEKCQMVQRRIARGLRHCFTKAEFVKEFLKPTASE